MHVVWEKFCRYFDVEPRIVPLSPGKYTIGPDDVAPHVDENTIGVAAVLGTTFTGHKDDIVGINDLLVRIKQERGLDVPLHVDGASGGFVWPFLYPDSPWDFRLEQVRSINVSGHKFGLVYPGIGWLIFRETSDLAPDLVFEENYLGKTDATFTLNFSTGSSMVLAQYYNLVRYGRAGYTYIMQNMQENARVLADKLEAMGRFEIIGREEEQLPLVAFRLAGEENYDEFDIAWQLSAERGWMVPAYTLPPNAQDVTIMRALVKETMSREHVDTLARDIEEACATLARKGGAHRVGAGQDRHRPGPLTVGCLFAIFAGVFPRLGLFIIWVARPERVDAAFGSFIWPLLGPDLPAVRDADLRHPLAGGRPERLGLVLGRRRRAVRRRSLGRERGPAPDADHEHGVGESGRADAARPATVRCRLPGEPVAQPGDVGGLALDAAGGLDDHRGAGGAHDVGEVGAVDVTGAEVGVPVGAGVELVAAVVAVHQVDPAGDGAHLLDDAAEVGAAGVGVAGVEAEPDGVAALGPADRLPEPLDRLEPAGHRVVAARGVLDEQRHRHLEAVDALAPVVEADRRSPRPCRGGRRAR